MSAAPGRPKQARNAAHQGEGTPVSPEPDTVRPLHAPRKYKIATVSLAGCFGCNMSFLDIDERLLQLLEVVEFDRSHLTDITNIGS